MKKFIIIILFIAFLLLTQVASAEDPTEVLRKAPELRVVAAQMGIPPEQVAIGFLKFNDNFAKANPGLDWDSTQQTRIDRYLETIRQKPFYTCGEDFCQRTSVQSDVIKIYEYLGGLWN